MPDADTAATPHDEGLVVGGAAAAGRIRGISHLALMTHDMEASVRFYRDVLGLRVVRTNPPVDTGRTTPGGEREPYYAFSRQYFFDMGNGELFSLYETDVVAPRFEASIVDNLWPEPPTRSRGVEHPQKLDHMAFDVASRDDLVWFRERLEACGISVSKIVERNLDPSHAKFVKSIYFYDPSGNPMEIATLDEGDPEWVGYDRSDWYRDDDPVPALTSPVDEPGRS
jgi:catechol 2,3-dioxygenase-like lactoylglutathione lyase family enzyme